MRTKNEKSWIAGVLVGSAIAAVLALGFMLTSDGSREVVEPAQPRDGIATTVCPDGSELHNMSNPYSYNVRTQEEACEGIPVVSSPVITQGSVNSSCIGQARYPDGAVVHFHYNCSAISVFATAQAGGPGMVTQYVCDDNHSGCVIFRAINPESPGNPVTVTAIGGNVGFARPLE